MRRVSSGEKLVSLASIKYIYDKLKESIDNNKITIATSNKAGSVKPVAKTSDMTQEVGSDVQGKLWTRPNNAEGGGGENGATFTPFVSSNGEISWTNDKGLENPVTVNIKGPQGEPGINGIPGINGKPGGYYILSVTQPDQEHMTIHYEPSKSDMPTITDVNITLPKGTGTGGGVVESVNGKTGKVVIKAQDIPNIPLVTVVGETLRFENIIDVTSSFNQMDDVIGGA